MAFNVNNMVSAINKTGVASLSHYEVFINGFGDTDSERDLSYRADSVDIPGRSITSVEHKFQNYGPVNKVAYGAVYGDVTVQFLLSEDFREKENAKINLIKARSNIKIDIDRIKEVINSNLDKLRESNIKLQNAEKLI